MKLVVFLVGMVLVVVGISMVLWWEPRKVRELYRSMLRYRLACFLSNLFFALLLLAASLYLEPGPLLRVVAVVLVIGTGVRMLKALSQHRSGDLDWPDVEDGRLSVLGVIFWPDLNRRRLPIEAMMRPDSNHKRLARGIMIRKVLGILTTLLGGCYWLYVWWDLLA